MPVSELKPCPFCGSELVEAVSLSSRSGKHMVHPRPDMHCPGASLRVWTDRPESVANWNRRAALEAALSVPQGAPEWRTMDSAPKDGTEILIANEFVTVRIGFWDEARDGVWSIWPGRDRAYPTHWMPLPPSPHPEGRGE